MVAARLPRTLAACAALAVVGLLVGSPGAGARVGAKPIGKIVFNAGGAAGDSNIYTVNADGSHFRQLTNTQNVSEQSPSWAPDGKSFVYVKATGNGSIYRMKAGGGKPRLLYKEPGTGGAIIQNPVWSPTGTRIAFNSTRLSNTWTIWTYGPAGRLTEVTSTFSVNPTWSPNGRQIAYASLDGIAIVGFRGGRSRPVPNTSRADCCPVWSPNGKWIALRSLNAGWRKHEIDSLILVNPTGTVRRQLIRGGVIFPQSWSPASDAVLVWRSFGKQPNTTRSQLFIVPLDGGRPRPVDGTNGASGASWHR